MSLISRLNALAQQSTFNRGSSAPVSPLRLARSSWQVTSNTEDGDSDLPDLDSPMPPSSATTRTGERHRRGSVESEGAAAELRAQQAQLNAQRVYAKERMESAGLVDPQSEIDMTAFMSVRLNFD